MRLLVFRLSTRKMAAKLLVLFVVLLGIAVNEISARGRIVGGWDALPAQFPHQISLRIRGSHTCGGSIISPTWIVTAAHCVTGSVYDYTVVAGSNQLSRGGQAITAKRIISHENYGNFKNDIALIELSSPLTYGNEVKEIKLARSKVPYNSQVTISGWGRVSTGGQIPENLKYNYVQAVGTSCGGMNYNGLICLGHAYNNGACNGDSGGPAVYNNELVGIANFVVGGCGSSYPDGYASVEFFIDWVQRNTGLSL